MFLGTETPERNRMTALTADQFKIVARMNPHERLQSGLRFGTLTGKRLSAILKDNERGFPNDWADLAEYIQKDPHVASIFYTRKTNVTAARWIIEPDGDSADAELAAELCTEAVGGLAEFKTHCHDLLDAAGVGFSVLEIDWDPKPDLVRFRHLQWVHQRRFIWGDRYELMLARPGSRTHGDPLTPKKFITHVPKEQSGYPTRSGALQVCAWHWWFKRKATEWWFHNVETSGTPIVVGKYPSNTEKSVRQEFMDSLKRLSADHVGLVPTEVEVMVETAGAEALRGDNALEAFIKSMDNQLSKAIVGTTDLTEAGPNGSRAATETRKQATLDPRTVNDGEQLWGTFRRDLFTPFLEFNVHRFGGRMPPVPKGRFLHTKVDYEITPEVAGARAASLNEVRQAAGLDPIEGRDDPLLDEDRAAAASAVPTPAADGDPTPEGQPAPEASGAGDVQKTALNGAQVTALQGMVEAVAQGQLPRDSAVAMIEAAFPLTREQAEEIVGEAGRSFEPRQPESSGGSASFPFHRSDSRQNGSRTSSLPTSTNPIAMALSGRSGVRAR